MSKAKYASASISGLVLAGCLGISGAAAATVRPQALSRAALSCSLAPLSLVEKDLAEKVSSPASVKAFGGGLRCNYQVGSNPIGVEVVFNPEAQGTFAQIAKSSEQSGAVKISGIGQSAFSQSVHTSSATDSDLSVYGRGYDLSIAAASSLGNVEGLARAIESKL